MSHWKVAIVKNLLENCCRDNTLALVVLEIITCLPELEEKLRNSLRICEHDKQLKCFNSEFKEILILIQRKEVFKIERVSQMFKKVLSFDSDIEGLQRILNFVFNSFHRCTGKVLIDDEYLDCDFSCQMHLCCGLSVLEKYSCGCGKEEIFKWYPSNFFITFDFGGYIEILEKEMDLSQEITNLEEKINDNLLGRFKYSDTMIAYLATLLKKANVESCLDSNCSIKSSNVTFELSHKPEILFIAVKNSEKSSSLISFLQIVSINNSFDIADLFLTSSQNYILEGLVLETKNNTPILVHKYQDRWKIGIDEIYFDGIIRRVTNYSMKVSLLIYKKANRRNTNNIPRELEIKSPKSIKSQNNYFKEEIKETNSDKIEQEKSLEDNYKNPYKEKTLETKNPDSFTSHNKNDLQHDREIQSSKNDCNPFLRNNFGRKKQDQNLKELQTRDSPQAESPENTKNKNENKKEWTCECKIVNDYSFKVCNSCFKPRSGLKGWACKHCTTFNDNYSHRCEACYKYKDMYKTSYISVKKPEEEYWHCYTCFSLNIQNHLRCSNCKAIKPDT